MKNKNDDDWTEPIGLSTDDWVRLKEIKQLYEEGNLKAAMALASESDTVIREEIPPQIWLEMGGSLTQTGLRRLQESKLRDKGKER